MIPVSYIIIFGYSIQFVL